MMDGAHRFVERKIAQSVESRRRHWRRDFSSRERYEASIAGNRKRFLEKIGAVDLLIRGALDRFGSDAALVAETAAYCVYQVRWPVLDGVTGEGLLLEPRRTPVAHIVALPDADQTPEQLAGLAPGIPAASQFARTLAEAGCLVLVPTLISREAKFSGRPSQ